MKKSYAFPGILFLSFLFLSQIPACVHEPVSPQHGQSDSTIVPIDTTIIVPPDSSQSPLKPCNPDSVYFEAEILPILISNCAKSGCHDANSASDDIILDSYVQVIQTADISAGAPNDSELYEVITEDDSEKIMPPLPNPSLSPEQINLIATWISQGAKNLTCQDSSHLDTCDTLDISYREDLLPILDLHCVACHRGRNPSGNISLDSYAGLVEATNNGKLMGAIAQLPGFSPMPQGNDPLSDCTVAQFQSWINNDTPDN